MLVLSIVATVVLSLIVVLCLLLIPQLDDSGQLKVDIILMLIQAFAIITIWILYGQI